jgi:hypothetical protein
MKFFVSNCSDRKQSDPYKIVMKEIAEYVGRDYYAYGIDIRRTIKNEERYQMPMPKDLSDTP